MTVLVWYLLGALGGLAVVLLVSEAWADGSSSVDRVVRDALVDIDVERWDAEMKP